MRTQAVTVLLPLLVLVALPFSAVSANTGAPPRDPVLGSIDLCLPALLLAGATEGAALVVLGRLRGRPVRRLLVACGLVNVITVTALAILSGSQAATIPVLIAAEILIWVFEGAFLLLFPGTGVGWKEGLAFSLVMNLTSLLAGWAVVLSI